MVNAEIGECWIVFAVPWLVSGNLVVGICFFFLPSAASGWRFLGFHSRLKESQTALFWLQLMTLVWMHTNLLTWSLSDTLSFFFSHWASDTLTVVLSSFLIFLGIVNVMWTLCTLSFKIYYLDISCHLCVFILWEEARIPREKQTRGEDTGSKQKSHWPWATALAAAPSPCREALPLLNWVIVFIIIAYLNIFWACRCRLQFKHFWSETDETWRPWSHHKHKWD